MKIIFLFVFLLSLPVPSLAFAREERDTIILPVVSDTPVEVPIIDSLPSGENIPAPSAESVVSIPENKEMELSVPIEPVELDVPDVSRDHNSVVEDRDLQESAPEVAPASEVRQDFSDLLERVQVPRNEEATPVLPEISPDKDNVAVKPEPAMPAVSVPEKAPAMPSPMTLTITEKQELPKKPGQKPLPETLTPDIVNKTQQVFRDKGELQITPQTSSEPQTDVSCPAPVAQAAMTPVAPLLIFLAGIIVGLITENTRNLYHDLHPRSAL